MDLEQLKRYLEPRARSLADIFVNGAEWSEMERHAYGDGEESHGWTWGKPKTPLNPNDHDCSGYYGSDLKFTRALNEGSHLGLPGNARWPQDKTYTRPTARVFHALSVPVTDGTVRTGDCITFQRVYRYLTGKRKGQIRYAAPPHHVVFVTRQRDEQWWTSEARKGTERNLLTDVLGRKYATGLRRLPGLDLGEVTLPPLELGIAAMDLTGYRPTLGRGSKTFHVSPLKRCLNYHLHHSVSLTNWTFGRVTEGYVRTFQELKGLPVTGVVDAATWEKLLS